MLKRIVLHIGAEKTGTTSIQEFLYLNRDTLLSHGICFPKSPGEKNHVRLTLAAAAESRPLVRRARKQVFGGDSIPAFRSRIRQQLQEEVAGTGAATLVLSNEHMHPHLQTEEEVRRLKDLLPPAEEVVVVFYVRRQDQFALSLHSTALKAGSRRQHFAFPPVREDGIPYRFDYVAAHRLWTSVFGADAMRVRIFHRRELLEGDLLRDFCAAADIPWSDDYAVPAAKNPSLDVNGEYIFREFNRIRLEAGDTLSPRAQMDVKRFLVSHFAGGVKARPPRSEAVAFFAQFKDLNEELRRLAWPQRRRPIFDRDFSEYPEEGTAGDEAVDHALICRTLLTAWLQEAGTRKVAGRRAAARRRAGGVKGVLEAMGRAIARRKTA